MTKYNKFVNEVTKTKTASILRAYEITKDLLTNSNLSEDDDFTKQDIYDKANELLSLVLASNLNGDEDDFHNYSLVFVEMEYYDQALKILEAGLKRYESNTDLLSDYLKYLPSSSTEDWREKCKLTYEKLTSISKLSWNWRAYHFSIEYLLKLIENSNIDIKALKTECLSLSKEFSSAFPNDERVYLAEAAIRLAFREEHLAMKVWQRAIEKDGLRCPRCAISLAEKIFDQKDYEKTLIYLIRAEKDAIDLRGNFDFAYIYYCRLLSQISQFIINTHQKIEDSEENDKLNKLVEEIFSNYHLLKKLWKNKKDKLRDVERYVDFVKLRSKISDEMDDE